MCSISVSLQQIPMQASQIQLCMKGSRDERLDGLPHSQVNISMRLAKNPECFPRVNATGRVGSSNYCIIIVRFGPRSVDYTRVMDPVLRRLDDRRFACPTLTDVAHELRLYLEHETVHKPYLGEKQLIYVGSIEH